MPRARNIKPGFFKDAKVVACSFPARLLFAGLWCLADYVGRVKYVPVEIKMEIFPGDNVNIEDLMTELSQQKLIEIYREHSESTLVQVLGFSKHQNPHQNERFDKDKKPAPCLPSSQECTEIKGEKSDIKQRVESALGVLSEYSRSDPADSLNLIPDSLNLIPDSDPPDQELLERLFSRFWAAGMKKVKKPAAVKSFNKIINLKTNQEEFVDWLVQDIQRRLDSKQLGFEEMHPTTYLNGQRWEDERTLATHQNGNGNAHSGPQSSIIDRATDRSWANSFKIGDTIDQLEQD